MKLRLITLLSAGAVIIGVGVALLVLADERPTASAPPPLQERYASAAAGSVSPVGAAGIDLTGTAEPGVSSQTQKALNLDPASVTHVGSFALPSGGRHELYRATSRDGWTCIIEDRPVGIGPNGKPLGIYGGGCSPGSLPENGLKMSVSGAGDVDAPAGTAGVSIVGIAGSKVHRIMLRLTNGALVPVPLNAANAFQYAVSPRDAGTTSSPATVVAFDSVGKKVNEKALG